MVNRISLVLQCLVSSNLQSMSCYDFRMNSISLCSCSRTFLACIAGGSVSILDIVLFVLGNCISSLFFLLCVFVQLGCRLIFLCLNTIDIIGINVDFWLGLIHSILILRNFLSVLTHLSQFVRCNRSKLLSQRSLFLFFLLSKLCCSLFMPLWNGGLEVTIQCTF